MRTLAVFTMLAGCLTLPSLVGGAGPGSLLAKIKAIGKEGAGNVEAAKAHEELVQLGPGVLIDVLAAFDDADPVAANWLRAAVDTIAEREMAAGRPLPTAKLETFVKDRRRDGAARRLAYDWLARVDPTTPDRLLPGMLDDPGPELRRDAVAAALNQLQTLRNKESAREGLRKVFDAARDVDQVEQIASRLADFGIPVDLSGHFGFIQQWQLAGPFENRGGNGFSIAYPPENGVDLNATYVGKEGVRVTWKNFTTADPPGKVDLTRIARVDVNTVIGKHMGALVYAFAAIESPQEQAVEVRAATPNALKLFLNGKEILSREEYHRNGRLDTHTARGLLRAGRNELLVKLCQNEQPDAWAQEWVFQVRFCDSIGGAVPLTVLPPETRTPRDTASARAGAHAGSGSRTQWRLPCGLVVVALITACVWGRSGWNRHSRSPSLVAADPGTPAAKCLRDNG